MSFATGLVYDNRYLEHDPGEFLIRYTERYPFDEVEPHPSGPVVVRRTHKLLNELGFTGALSSVAGRPATTDEIERVHTPEMRRKVEAISKHGGDAGFGSPIAAGGEEIARLAAGGAIAAVDAVLNHDVRNAFGLIRPPGHHATATESLGFCVYNNIAFAARHAQQVHGLGKIAIVDWDVHHGNGTQDIFWHDNSVLFISLHQDNLFPIDWGKVQDCGEGDGLGTTVNIPLPAGSGNAVYLAAIEEIVVPIIRQFVPELILISAGQDASVQDPLGRMTVTVPAYQQMTELLRNLADETCDGRLVALMEGGYSNYYAPFCTVAIVEGLMANPPAQVPDPYSPRSEMQPGTSTVSLDQRAALDAVKAAQRKWWEL
jgi:acetoin utilization deacetylase AcuC-like enzyme